MTYGGRVFIGGISSNVSKDDIGNEFSKFGKLRSVWVAARPHGFAFVEYDNDRDAEEAVRSCNGVSLFNENKVRVEISKKRPGQNMPNRRGGMNRGPSNRSDSSFRTGNTTSFKPNRFLSSNSSSRPSGGFNKRLPSSAPFNNQLSSSRPRQNTNPRFVNSSSSRPAPRYGSGGGRNESSGFFSGSKPGYKSGNFRGGRPMKD